MKKLLLSTVCGMGIGVGMILTPSTASAQVVVRIGPPPPVRERIPPRPHEHPDWAWHAGYHRWDGNRYLWVPGSYVAPPRPRAVWIPGRWDRRGGGYVWVEGHWR